MLSYINIQKIRIIYLKMIILQYIKDCFKRICFQINLLFFCVCSVIYYRLARSDRNEKHETQKHTCKSNTCYPVLFPLCSDVFCQLLCALCAKQELCVSVLMLLCCLRLS